MTGFKAGSEHLIFPNREALSAQIWANIELNQNRKIGMEWERALLTRDGRAINRADGQKAFRQFYDVFANMGYEPDFIFEGPFLGNAKPITGVKVPGLGIVGAEIGHQFEFSGEVCDTIDEVGRKNVEYEQAMIEVARRVHYSPNFVGHIPGHAATTEGAYRRWHHWRMFFSSFGAAAAAELQQVLEETCAAQVTLDGGGKRFHKFGQGMLLLDPIFTLHYRNSLRPYISVDVHRRHMGSHIEPLTGIWGTRTPRDALDAIMDRFMELKVPFLFDSERPGEYKQQRLPNGEVPTIQNYLERDLLSEKIAYNAGPFFQTHPAFRNLSQALWELRGPDSQSTAEEVTDIGRRTQNVIYNDAVLDQMLSEYSAWSRPDLKKLHDAAATRDIEEGMNMIIRGMPVREIVKDIMIRSEEELPAARRLPTTGMPWRHGEMVPVT